MAGIYRTGQQSGTLNPPVSYRKKYRQHLSVIKKSKQHLEHIVSEAWQNKVWLDQKHDQKHEASLLEKSPKSFLSGGIFLLGAWDYNLEVILK